MTDPSLEMMSNWPALGLSTRELGAAPSPYVLSDDNESIAAIRRAFELGIRFLETSPVYGDGRSENLIGRALSDVRGRLRLSTEAAASRVGVRGVGGVENSSERVINSCLGSLRRLGTESVDVYLLNLRCSPLPAACQLDAIREAGERGLFRFAGLREPDIETLAAVREHLPIACVIAAFSLFNRRPMENLIPYCLRHRIAFVASSPLGRGLLSGRLEPSTRFRDVRMDDADFQGERYLARLRKAARLAAAAAEWGMTLPELALTWVTSTPGVTSTLVGMRRISQVEMAARVLGRTLSEPQRLRLDEILAAERD